MNRIHWKVYVFSLSLVRNTARFACILAHHAQTARVGRSTCVVLTPCGSAALRLVRFVFLDAVLNVYLDGKNEGRGAPVRAPRRASRAGAKHPASEAEPYGG